MNSHIMRAYNSYHIDHARGIFTKSSNTARLANEINYYKSIPNSLRIHYPRLVSSNSGINGANSLSLEYYGYSNLATMAIFENCGIEELSRIIESIFSVLDLFSKEKLDASISLDNSIKSMYLDKTEHYYNELVKSNESFRVLSEYDSLVINGKVCRNFNRLWGEIKKVKFTPIKSVVHGDLCFSNILVGANPKTPKNPILKFVDPRGSFGEFVIVGDTQYDYAKLLHSCDGAYENIIYDQFEVAVVSNTVNLGYKLDHNRKFLTECVLNLIPKSCLFQVKLITGLIFVGMCSRHYDSLNRQLAMYATGIRLLNEAYENLH